jgi:hypothetical protein
MSRRLAGKSEVRAAKERIGQATEQEKAKKDMPLYDEAQLLDTHQASKYLGISESFLRKSRCEGCHSERTEAPPFVCVGGRRLYRLIDLSAWLNNLPTYNSIAEFGQKRGGDR